MYAQDYDETLVPTQVATAGGDGALWPALVQPYIKNDQVRRCPSDALRGDNSYGLNELVFVDLTEPAALLQPVNTLASVQTPSMTVMIAELGEFSARRALRPFDRVRGRLAQPKQRIQQGGNRHGASGHGRHGFSRESVVHWNLSFMG